MSVSAQAQELHAHGTQEMFWVGRIVAPGEGRSIYTVIRGRSVGADGAWSEIARPAARVVSMAHRGRELAVLFDSGAWMLLWKEGSSSGAMPDDGARLLALASDDQAIWAIGAGGRELLDSPTTTAAMAPATAPARSGRAGPRAARVAAPTTERSADALAVYRLERGSWKRTHSLPAEVSLEDLPNASLAIIRGHPMLSVLRAGKSVQTFILDDRQWRELDSLDAGDAQQLKLLTDGDGAILWLAGPSGGGRIYARGAAWSQPRELSVRGPLSANSARATAFAGENLRLLFIHDRQIFEQTLSRDGSAMYPAAELPALRTSTSDTPNRILTAAAAAMLVLVVFTSLRRGGGAAPTSVAAEAGLKPAPLVFRFIAGTIDASPLLVMMFIIFRDLDPTDREFEKLADSMSLPFYVALGAYLAYTCLTELILGRTIGKMLFGMRVVALDGSRPTAGAIFARNALRLVDVTMLAIPLILVVLSPLHQRVGDIAAGTIVVRGRTSDESQESKKAGNTT